MRHLIKDGRIWQGGIWQRRRGAGVTTIPALYGTGVGQVPLHLAPEDAVLDGSGNVVSLANRGGAGAAFNATAGGTVARSGSLLSLNGGGWLDMAAPADVVGVRLFVVAAVDFAVSGNTARTVASGDAGTPGTTADDNSLELVFYPGLNTRNFRVSRGGTQTVIGGIPTDGLHHLWEFEILPDGTGNLFVDGVLTGTHASMVAGATTIQRLFSRTATGAANLVGTVGDVLSLIVDGSGNQAAQIAAIRQSLMAKNGMLPGVSALYGTGLGQVPLHLAPEDALLDGNGTVLSVPNRGGAGAAFNATAGGTAITRSGNLLNLGATNAWLTLANPANAVGTRLFVVAAASTSGTRRVASHDPGTAGNAADDTNIHYRTSGTLPDSRPASVMRLATASGGSAADVGRFPRLPDLALLEIECKPNGDALVLYNGGYANAKAAAWPTGTFPLSRLFAGQDAAANDGLALAGDVISLVIDGSADVSAQITTIRQALLAKYNLTAAP